MSSAEMPSTKTPPVTVYVLKKDRLALLDDITDILKDERLMLSSRCIDRLGDCLMAKLEPTLIPHDRDDPNRAINMLQSARLRNIKTQGPTRVQKRTTTSKHTAKSHRRPDFIPYVRFGTFGGPRNIHESFMDREFIRLDGASESEVEDEHDEAQAIAEAAKQRLESRDKPSTDVHNHFGGPRNVHESFISGSNIAYEHKPPGAARARASKKTKTSLAPQPPSKKDTFEHSPEGVSTSFYFPNTAPSFAQVLPNVDQSAYCKPAAMKERADALIKDEPIDITKGDYLIFEGKKLVRYQASNLVPAPKTSKKEVERMTGTGYQPEDILASVDMVIANPDLTVVKAEEEATPKTQVDNNIDVGKTHPNVKHASPPPPIPTITITEDTAAAIAAGNSQNSSQSSNSSKFQSSPEDGQAPQDTPDSTFFSQSQEVLIQSQGPVAQSHVPAVTQNIDPKDLLQLPAPTQTDRKKKALKAPKKPVEINPRRSARLAEKMPNPTMQAPKARKATKATASATTAPPPVLTPSAKRGPEDEDRGDEEERGGRNKKVISQAAVEKQRETRGRETTKRGGDRRTVLERRGV